MTTSNISFLPGEADYGDEPLGRYLPRLPVGAVSHWLQDQLPAHSWIIDPFGVSPHLAIEAAQAGYRVLVVSNNPITRFVLETKATPPLAEDMQAALAILAATRRGDERLENHIRQLYQTRCRRCEEMVDAQAFLWERNGQVPYARIYSCPNCQHSGEHPTTPEDAEKINQISPAGLYRARALERVAASDDPNRYHVEEALEAYLPRAVYTLINLVNKLDGLNLSLSEGKYLRTLLLTACDQANNLWRVPAEQYRPRQLTTPPRFMEKNIWLALEDAVNLWATNETAVPLTFWPDTPPETGGICLLEGRIKRISSELGDIPIGAIVSAFPRPNQAYWTLCALWAGWLWGREAIGPFSRVLKRRRYDWAWHTAALYNSLDRLSDMIPEKMSFLGLVTENEAGFDTAALVAADLAGFSLQGTALRVKTGQTQLHWVKQTERSTPSTKSPLKIAIEAIYQIIQQRGEPTSYLYLQAAGLQALSSHSLLSPTTQDQPIKKSMLAANAYNDARQQIRNALAQPGVFIRYQGGKSSIEIGSWWLRRIQENATPLADRVEIALVDLLQKKTAMTFAEIDQTLCHQFTGAQTPDLPLIEAILKSYAEHRPDGLWHLRENDTTPSRRADIKELKVILAEIGERMGFSTQTSPEVDGQVLIWEKAQGRDPLYFYLIASAVLDKIVNHPPHPPEQGVIVLPGSRSGLVLHKRSQNPYLDYLLDGGWRLLKFRSVRRLHENKQLSGENLASHFALDPLGYDDAQLPLL
jgi:hypothetical protein